MERFCAVIPALNEARRIGDVVRGARPGVETVLVVDDGSGDETASVAQDAGAIVVKHPTNLGKGRALQTGIQWACQRGYDAVITLDADGQHLPAEIPLFTGDFSAHHADVVVGTRMANCAGMPFVRRMTNRVTSAIVSMLAGRRITDSQSGFRLLKCRTAGQLTTKGSRFDAESEILVKAGREGLSIREVAVSTVYGDEKSKIHPARDTWRFILLVLRLIFVER